MKYYEIAESDYKLTICDHTLDNIYGQIGFTEVEKKIERLSIFKRLHHISQLGLVSWIFPCALHTRYTHSIGVMHVIGEMASHININMKEPFFNDCEIQILRLTGLLHDIGHYPLSHNLESAYRDAQHLDGYKQSPISEHKNGSPLKYFTNCPDYLHPAKMEAEQSEPTDETIKDDGLLNADKFRKDLDCKGSTRLHHEAVGASIITKNAEIRNIIKKYFVLCREGKKLKLNRFFAPKDLKKQTPEGSKKPTVDDKTVDAIVANLLFAIGSLITGNYEYEYGERSYPDSTPPEKYYGWMKKYSAMIQLIHSDLDADNLDYLMRDATFSGTSYGTLDMGLLLNCLYVKEINFRLLNVHYPENSQQRNDTAAFAISDNIPASIPPNLPVTKEYKRYIVGVTEKGVGAIDQYLSGKFMAYRLMILSKYVSILEAMFYQVASETVVAGNSLYCEKKLLDTITKGENCDINYLDFSDNYIFSQLYSLAGSSGEKRQLIRKIISRLSHLCAFDLADADEKSNNECIYIGTASETDILKYFREHQLYQDFLNTYDPLKSKTLQELMDENSDDELFAYKFAEFSLTKQVPIKKFQEAYGFQRRIPEVRFMYHYYRLANGIPVFNPDKEYSCQEQLLNQLTLANHNINGNITRELVMFILNHLENLKNLEDLGKFDEGSIPPLCVDSPSSALKDLHQLRFVSLRKYKIADWSPDY